MRSASRTCRVSQFAGVEPFAFTSVTARDSSSVGGHERPSGNTHARVHRNALSTVSAPSTSASLLVRV